METTEGLKTSETASTCGHKRERDGKGSCKGLATVATAVATGRRGGTTWLRSGARPAAAPTALALSPPPPRRRRPRRRRVKWGRCLRSSLLCGPLRESRHCKIVTGVMMSRSARAQECDCVPHSRYSSCGGAPKPCGRRGPRLPCPRPQSDRAPRPAKPAPSMRFARARACVRHGARTCVRASRCMHCGPHNARLLWCVCVCARAPRSVRACVRISRARGRGATIAPRERASLALRPDGSRSRSWRSGAGELPADHWSNDCRPLPLESYSRVSDGRRKPAVPKPAQQTGRPTPVGRVGSSQRRYRYRPRTT